ncbi:MAG TPA: tetratricopeptide repeat protein [Planctomycetota bacterium]|nr:tetratricopeptide repeat protein [Planctomycetota bacterium]
MSPRGRRLLLVAILAAAAALRLAALLDLRANDPLFPSRQTFSDGRYYHEWAVALAEGRAFPPEPPGKPHWMPPLFPWALSLLYRAVGPRPLALVLAHHALGMVGLLLLHGLARRAFGEGAALVAVALGAFYLPIAFLEGKPMAETLAAFLALAGLRIVCRSEAAPGNSRRSAAGGLLLGLASCARPQLLPALPAVALALSGKSARSGALAFLGAAVLAPGATLVRNLAVSGQPVLVSANGGVNFYFGNHPGVRGTFRAPGPQWASIFEQRETALREVARGREREAGESAASAYFYRRGLSWIASEPGEAAAAWGAKAACLLSNEEVEIVYSPAAEGELAGSLRLFFVPFALIAGLVASGFAGAPAVPGARRILSFYLLAGAALQVAFFPYSRFRVLLLPALLPFAGAGALAVFKPARGRGATFVRAVALLVSSISLLAPREAAQGLRANAFVDIGNAWRDQGDLARAEGGYRRSIEIRPNARAALALAELFERTGRIREAETILREVAAGSTVHEEARYRLGVLYLRSTDPAVRRPEEARRLFEELLRADPRHYEARCGLGTYFAERGDYAEAVGQFERALALDRRRPEAWNGVVSALESSGRHEEAAAARARAAEATRRF